MPYFASWTVQPDASPRAEYTDCLGDPCHLIILPEDGGVLWSAVATYGTHTFDAPSVANAIAKAEDEANRQDWSHGEPEFMTEGQDSLDQASIDLLRSPGHGR